MQLSNSAEIFPRQNTSSKVWVFGTRAPEKTLGHDIILRAVRKKGKREVSRSYLAPSETDIVIQWGSELQTSK